MNLIKYFALGGQDEKGKYSAILEINDDLFIINTGIGMDITNQFGIRKVIPNLQFIKENKKRIKGIFLGTPKNINIGSLPFFLKTLDNVPIYTSKVGETIIHAWFLRRSKSEVYNKDFKKNIQVVEPKTKIKVGSIEITPFKVFSSIPDSYGWIFHTSQGAIVHIDQFLVGNESWKGFENQIYDLPQLTNNHVLVLFVGGQNAVKNPGFAAPNYQTYTYLKKQIANTSERNIVACYDHDWLTVLNIVEIAKTYDLKLAIYSGTLIKLFKQLVKMRYIDVRKLKLMNPNNIEYDSDSLILITGNQDRLYYKMHKIVTGEDANIKFDERDSFILATITESGLELQEAKLLDEVSRNDISTKKLPRTVEPPMAGLEDHKTLANLLKPQYVFLVDCYYKEFVAYDRAISGIVEKKKIKFLNNGEIASFKQAKLQKIFQTNVGEQYVDSFGVVDIGTSILFERQNMYQYGLIALNTIYDKDNHQFSQPHISIHGLITSDHFKHEQIINLINKACKNELEKTLGLAKSQSINYKELKHQLKRSVLRMLERQIQKKPLVLVTIKNL